MEFRAEKDPQRPMGYARIVVEGLGAPLPAATVFIIRREGFQEANLGLYGWQVQEERLQPIEILEENGAAVLIVGPPVTRYLESSYYVFQIPGSRGDGHLFWPDDIDIFDGDLPPERPRTAAPAVSLTAAQPTPPVQPLPKPVVEPPVQPPTGPLKPSRAGYYVLGGLLLLIMLVVGAWYGSPELRAMVGTAIAEITGTQPPPPPAVTPPPPPLPPPQQQQGQAPAPPAGVAWPDGTDAFSAREIVEKAPNAGAIFQVAQRRQAAGRHEDALQLIEEAVERGHSRAMTGLARLYDPNGFVPGKPFRSPDLRNAADYYKRAVEKGDTEAAAPRAALKATLESEARNGNSSATAALREFWP